ncbi:MAG TPA: GFA family protein [Gammaproteobacteria bacterium]|nr:GFA family protein [Gammaproteobacteria bacterium]
MSTSTRGACLCGAVTFAIAPPYRWFAHCHCSLCRKHHGSLFSTGLGVARANLEWLGKSPKGGDAIVHYRATAAFERPFCRHCGSTVPGASHDAGFWHVPAGLLQGDPGARPRSHIFVASKSPLFEIADALPRFAAYPPGIDLPTIERRREPAPPGTIVGSCLCNAVAFGVEAMPRRVVNCYCSLCRRRSGAGFTSTLVTTASEFRWLRGQARVTHFKLPPPRQYGADFCADCGSPVPSFAATTVLLPAGAMDDPWKSSKGDDPWKSPGDTDLPALPAVHLYVGSKAPWVTIADEWPQFDALPPPGQLKDYFP